MRPVTTRSWACGIAFCLAASGIAAGRCAGGDTAADDDADDLTVRVVTEFPQPTLAAATPVYRPVRLSADAERTEAILAALAKADSSLSFSETPLRDLVETIGEKAGIAVGIDARALEDSGIDPDSPVSGSSSGRPLLHAVRSMLEPLGLVAVVRHGRLLVTTHERSQDTSYLERVLYPILPGSDPEEIRNLIESTVAPETWDSVGGTSSARPLPADLGSGLIVSQTEENHEAIATLLGGIDRGIWKREGEGPAARIVRAYPVSDHDAREGLAARLVGLCNESLPEGGDPDASVQILGESLVVQSTSRAFHVMAAAIITAIDGVESILIEEEDAGEDAEQPATVQATSSRR